MAKGKGSEFERAICKKLTVWLTGKVKPYAFWRSPSSGALATLHEENENLSGDVIGVTEEAKVICDIINFELKTGYKETSLDKFLKYNKNDNFKNFWQQCIDESCSKYPVIVYRKKGFKDPWVGINNDMFNKFESKLNNFRYLIIHFRSYLPDLYIFSYNEFFDTIKPKDIRELKSG